MRGRSQRDDTTAFAVQYLQFNTKNQAKSYKVICTTVSTQNKTQLQHCSMLHREDRPSQNVTVDPSTTVKITFGRNTTHYNDPSDETVRHNWSADLNHSAAHELSITAPRSHKTPFTWCKNDNSYFINYVLPTTFTREDILRQHADR